MKIETAGAIHVENATLDDLGAAFADDAGRGEFIILSRGEYEFIQAGGEGDGPYAIEYREGDAQYEAAEELPKQKAALLFLQYYQGDPAFKTACTWKPLKTKSGRLGLALLCVAFPTLSLLFLS